MLGRPDDPKVMQGAELLRNWFVESSGTARRVPGTEFVRASRNEALRSRLVTFTVSGGDDVFVELGFRQEYPATSSIAGYARFHTRGATLLHSVPYSNSTAYLVGDRVMSAGVLYLCVQAHTNQPVSNAAFWDSLEWTVDVSIPTGGGNPGLLFGTPGTIRCGVAHGLRLNDPVELTSSGGITAPNGLVYGVIYYASPVNSTDVQLLAAPGGSPLAITADGSPPGFRLHRRYVAGDLVSKGGQVYYCRQTRPIDGGNLSIAPDSGNEVFWAIMPASGLYELPTTLAISEEVLFELTYSQQGSVLCFAGRSVPPAELVRVNGGTWVWREVVFEPPVAPPVISAEATRRGATLTINGLDQFASPNQSVRTVSEHRLVPGLDYVYIEGSARASLNDNWWAVEPGIDAFNFRVRNPETGVLPAIIGAVASGGSVRVGRLNTDPINQYQVTSVAADGQESRASVAATVNNNLFTVGAYNTISWSAVPGAARYRVYKLRQGTNVFGFIGESQSTSFIDGRPDNIAPDLSKTPPILDTSMGAAAGRRPRAVAHFEGRRCFAGTDLDPQTVWMTRSNTDDDLSSSFPVKATDRVKQQVKSRLACTIRHMVPMGQMIVLSDTTEFRVSPLNSDAITPDSFAARAQTYVGAAAVQPIVAQNVVLFAGARGGHVYQLGYRDDAGGYLTADLCERATHLFDNASVVQMAWQQSPVPVAWVLSNTGQLLGCTYVPMQQVFAWWRRDTDGVFESVAAGGEGGEDRLYAIVRRTVNGQVRRYVERLASMTAQTWANSWFVDSGLRYQGTPVSTLLGLGHLEGATVAVWADGLEQTNKVVTGGQITLDVPASSVLVGLPMVAQLRTPPAVFAMEALGQGRPKSVTHVYLRVEASGSMLIGPSLADMLAPPEVVPGAPFSGLLRMQVPNEWTADGQLYLEVRSPVPCAVVSMFADMAMGD
jgi:hypothetical protein